MAARIPALTDRTEGRMFSMQGRLCLVLDVDAESSLARVSCPAESGRRIVEMPISEVNSRLSSDPKLPLVAPNTAETSNRITQQSDGWFFSSREGLKGPYGSDTEAKLALSEYILSFIGRAD
jgi:hypothetical protein